VLNYHYYFNHTMTALTQTSYKTGTVPQPLLMDDTQHINISPADLIVSTKYTTNIGGAATLTPAQIRPNAITDITSAGPAAAYVLPSSASLRAAFPRCQINDGWTFSLNNLGTGSNTAVLTVSADTNVVVAGGGYMTLAIAGTGSSGTFKIVRTGTDAWRVFRV
jgi:hypothetical protein